MSRVARLLYRFTAYRPCRLIRRGPDDGPYLERYFLCRIRRKRVYLHRFVGDDIEEVHSHPWPWAVSIVLTGWYWERVLVRLTGQHGPVYQNVLRSAGHMNRIPGGRYHTITQVRPETWTLFIIPDMEQDWGFLRVEHDAQGWVYSIKDMPRRDEKALPWWKRAPRGKDAGREPLCNGQGAPERTRRPV